MTSSQRLTVRRSTGLLMACIAAALLDSTPLRAEGDDDVMHTALRTSFTIEADDARQAAAGAALWGAIDAFMPTVTWNQEVILNSNYKYSSELAILSDGVDTVSRHEPDLQILQVSLPLFDGFRRVNTVRAQSSLYAAGQFQNLNVRQTVLLDTATASLTVARNRRIVDLRRSYLGDLVTIEQRSRTRFTTRDVTMTDVALAQSRVDEAQTALDESLSDLTTSEIEFTRVSGSDPDKAGRVTVPNDAVPASLDEFLARLPQQNPQLRSGELEVTAADYAALAARAEVMPQLNLVALHGRQDNVSVAEKTVQDTTVKVQLQIPIYEPGAFPRILQASAQATQKHYEFLDRQNRLIADAKALFLSRRSLVGQIATASKRVETVRRAVEGYNVELAEGYRTLVDALNTRAELTRARIGLIDLQLARDKQTLTLTAALALLDPRPAARPTMVQSVLAFAARKSIDPLGPAAPPSIIPASSKDR